MTRESRKVTRRGRRKGREGEREGKEGEAWRQREREGSWSDWPNQSPDPLHGSRLSSQLSPVAAANENEEAVL